MKWRLWLHGLAGAAIGGASNAVTLVLGNAIDPKTISFSPRALGICCGISALISTALYLKQSPVPPEDGV